MLRTYRSVLPTVDPSAFVDVSAQVIGDVHIGPESSVWMNVVVRGDVNHIRIGARTNVQDLTLVHVMRHTHPTVIGDDVTIGHGALIHGCTIEERCIIGMGAIVMDQAIVHARCIVGAGALVTGGTEIPEGHLVLGAPARAKRELTHEELAWIEKSANHYVDLARRYLAPGEATQ